MLRFIIYWLASPIVRRSVLWSAVFLIILLAMSVWFGVPSDPLTMTIGLLAPLTMPTIIVAKAIRFSLSTRGFKVRTGDKVQVRYSCRLDSILNINEYIATCEKILTESCQAFGLSLRRRLIVFLFDRVSEVNRFFQTPRQGSALTGGDAILVAADSRRHNLEGLTRHEITHLLAWYVNGAALEFNNEGLAVWLEKVVDNKPVDFYALAQTILRERSPLLNLHEASYFYGTDGFSYDFAIAGSFTGFLIRRFGWTEYLRYFQQAVSRNYSAVFQQIFGMTLTEAEIDWHRELHSMRESFEPGLSAFLVGGVGRPEVHRTAC